MQNILIAINQRKTNNCRRAYMQKWKILHENRPFFINNSVHLFSTCLHSTAPPTTLFLSHTEQAMILKASPSLSLQPPSTFLNTTTSSPYAFLLHLPTESPRNRSIVAMAAAGEVPGRPITGVVFQPFEELQQELNLVPSVPDQSLARHKYSNDCEAALNEQIKWVLFSIFVFLLGLNLF